MGEVSVRKGGKALHSETRTPAAHNHPKHKVHAIWPPWTAGPLVLAVGSIFHHLWGRAVPSAAILPVVLLLSTAGLSALTHRYASPRNNVQQWHAVLTVLVLGLSVSAVEIFGGLSAVRLGQIPCPVPNVLGQSVLGLSAVLALSWNIRRFEVVRGAGQDSHGASTAEDDWLGLKKPKSFKIVSSDDKQTTARVRLSEGQTAEEVEKVLKSMGSSLGTITDGVRVVPGKKEGEIEVTALWEDRLTEAVGWDGPEHIGGSIVDPISLGLNEQQQRVFLRMGGDYKTGIAPGHVKIVGMPRTGKGIAALIIWANLRSRIDVYPVLNDAAKGEQMLGMLRPGMPKEKAWIDTTRAGAKAQAAAVQAAIEKRNKALGDNGMSSWTPKAFTEGIMWRGQRIHMPAVVFHIEEFAPIGIASPNIFTTIGEQALSAGIFLIVSLQRASYDRFPTSLRSLIGNGICYGCLDDADANFALPESATEGGATPAKWQQRYPGRAMASLNGQADGMERIPWKTHYAESQEAFEDYMRKVMAHLLPLAPDLDPCTAEAFGKAYADYMAGEPAATAKPQVGQPAQAPVAPDNDEEEDDEDDMSDDDDGETYVMPPTPEGCDASHIDPEQEIPDWSGPDIDLSPEPRAGLILGETSPEQKRKVFRQILQACVDRGEAVVTTGRLNDLWVEQFGYPKANQTPTISRFLLEAASEDADEDGRSSDLLGTIEPEIEGKRGRWRIMLRPRVAALNGHGA